MLAPRRPPPGAIPPKEESSSFKKPPGPVERPPERFTKSPRGRRLEKEKPFPPPVCWIRAATRRVEKIPPDSRPRSSLIGRTKQAASCPNGVPAPVHVGELGTKRKSARSLKKTLETFLGSFPNFFSGTAIPDATLSKGCRGVSIWVASSPFRT